LDAVKDDQGHADRAIAFAIALPSTLTTAREGTLEELYGHREEVLTT
jgi:hypothetical protein